MIFDTVNYTTSKTVRIKKMHFKKKLHSKFFFFQFFLNGSYFCKIYSRTQTSHSFIISFYIEKTVFNIVSLIPIFKSTTYM